MENLCIAESVESTENAQDDIEWHVMVIEGCFERKRQRDPFGQDDLRYQCPAGSGYMSGIKAAAVASAWRTSRQTTHRLWAN